MKRPPALALLLVSLAACGGTVVFEEDGAGGSTASATSSVTGNGGGPTATTTTGVGGASASVGTATASSATGSGGCTSHADCAGELCIFATGECAAACEDSMCGGGCGPDQTCDDCATSACADCLDCRGACVPLPPGHCLSNDACGEGEICNFFERRCVPECTPEGACADPNLVCARCETASCCGCADCAPTCIPPRD